MDSWNPESRRDMSTHGKRTFNFCPGIWTLIIRELGSLAGEMWAGAWVGDVGGAGSFLGVSVFFGVSAFFEVAAFFGVSVVFLATGAVIETVICWAGGLF